MNKLPKLTHVHASAWYLPLFGPNLFSMFFFLESLYFQVSNIVALRAYIPVTLPRLLFERSYSNVPRLLVMYLRCSILL